MIGRAGSQTELPLRTASGATSPQETAFCEYADCREPILDPRPGQKYCNDTCRVAQWRLDNPRPRRSNDIQDRFEAWLEENPHVWQLIRRYAYRVLESGRERFGIAAIVERVRWEIEIETTGDPFKINNDYRSRIVRKLIQEDSRFDDLFETRELKSR